MAEQETPQGDRPKRRSSRKFSGGNRSGSRGACPPQAPPRPHKKVTSVGGRPQSGVRNDKPQPSQPSAVEAKARGWWAEFMRYLRSVKAEFHRVTWPSKQELKTATMVVVATLIVLTVYLFLVNVVFTAIFSRF